MRSAKETLDEVLGEPEAHAAEAAKEASTREPRVPKDIHDRLGQWGAELTELRRTQGLWSTDDNGRPVCLAPDPDSGRTRDPVTRDPVTPALAPSWPISMS